MRFFLFFICVIQLTAGIAVREVSLEGPWLEIYENDDQDISELIFSDGSRVQYEYQDRRLAKIRRLNASGEQLYDQTYDWDETRLTGQTGWFSTRYIYDDKDRVIAKLNPWYQGTIEYDAVGRAVRVGDRIYSYDVFGQITDEQGYFHAAYDGACNLIELNGHRIEVDAQNGLTRCKYDRQGNPLREDFSYDEKNQLVEACGEQYAYDSYGRRTRKGDTCYLYIGFEEIASFENGQCKTLQIPGIGGPIAIEIDGKPYAPVIDAQGIIRKLIDPITNSIYTLRE